MTGAEAREVVLDAVNSCRAMQDLGPLSWDEIAVAVTVRNLRNEAYQAGDDKMVRACRVLMQNGGGVR
jgi:hypothetical protein